MAALKHDTYDGPPSHYTCPGCGGALWEVKDRKLSRFRCHVGHSFTEQSLLGKKTGQLEAALWTALRALEEHADLRRRLARRSGSQPYAADKYQEQADEAERRASVIRAVLLGNGQQRTVSGDPASAPIPESRAS